MALTMDDTTQNRPIQPPSNSTSNSEASKPQENPNGTSPDSGVQTRHLVAAPPEHQAQNQQADGLTSRANNSSNSSAVPLTFNGNPTTQQAEAPVNLGASSMPGATGNATATTTLDPSAKSGVSSPNVLPSNNAAAPKTGLPGLSSLTSTDSMLANVSQRLTDSVSQQRRRQQQQHKNPPAAATTAQAQPPRTTAVPSSVTTTAAPPVIASDASEKRTASVPAFAFATGRQAAVAPQKHASFPSKQAAGSSSNNKNTKKRKLGHFVQPQQEVQQQQLLQNPDPLAPESIPFLRMHETMVKNTVQQMVNLLNSYGPLTFGQLKYNLPPPPSQALALSQIYLKDILDLLVILGVIQVVDDSVTTAAAEEMTDATTATASSPSLETPPNQPQHHLQQQQQLGLIPSQSASTTKDTKKTTLNVPRQQQLPPEAPQTRYCVNFGVPRGEDTFWLPPELLQQIDETQQEIERSSRRSERLAQLLKADLASARGGEGGGSGRRSNHKQVLQEIAAEFPEVLQDPVWVTALKNFHIDFTTSTSTTTGSVGSGTDHTPIAGNHPASGIARAEGGSSSGKKKKAVAEARKATPSATADTSGSLPPSVVHLSQHPPPGSTAATAAASRKKPPPPSSAAAVATASAAASSCTTYTAAAARANAVTAMPASLPAPTVDATAATLKNPSSPQQQQQRQPPQDASLSLSATASSWQAPTTATAAETTKQPVEEMMGIDNADENNNDDDSEDGGDIGNVPMHNQPKRDQDGWMNE